MSSTNSTNSTFDGYTQYITILTNDGTPVLVSLADIDAGNWYDVAVCINYGAQLGACFVMFFVVLVLTKSHKRQSPIFILNILSLLFGFLRALMFAIYFVSPWIMLYPQWTTDVSGVPMSAYYTSVVASIIPLFMTITVDLSLVLQAHTVTKSMDDIYRYIVTGVAFVIFLLAVGFRMAVTITNSITILHADLYYSKQWISMGALVTETISVWFFSFIFTGKLVYTLWIRHRHGWKQWSGVRILAAMGGCTMVIPCKFSILF
jgi:pheromone alpha factor receptor